MRTAPAALLSVFLSTACAGRHSAPAAEPAAPSAPAARQAAATPAGDALVMFASDESMRRLERSHHKVDFFRLANQFEGQEHAGMCGPTTAVIVLNTLRGDAPDADKPVDRSAVPEKYLARMPPRFDPLFHRYTQRAFFQDPRITAVKSEDRFYGAPGPDGKPDPGIQLRQLHDILVALGVKSEIHVVADDTPEEQVRAALVGNLARAGDYAVVNYFRPVLGQEGGGHISPLGAYDEQSDSFLVLDVNPNRGKAWAWVPAGRLIAAMRTHDTIENRGYLLIGE